MGNEKREDHVWRAIKLLPFKVTVTLHPTLLVPPMPQVS